jgi:hypothetical protein
MKAHGELTAEMGERLERDLKPKEYDVLYDHGPSEDNVGKIVSGFGDQYDRESELSQLDIAVVKKNPDRTVVLMEIEETNDRPKTYLGDVFGVLMGDHIRFGGGRNLSVDERTTLLVVGISKVDHKRRNEHILGQVNMDESGLSTANSKIGKVVIRTFIDEHELFESLLSMLDSTFKGE